MKKGYVTPSANLIELKMNENIAANSGGTGPQTGEMEGGWKFTDSAGPEHCWATATGMYPSGYPEDQYKTREDMSVFKESDFYLYLFQNILSNDGPGVAYYMQLTSTCSN